MLDIFLSCFLFAFFPSPCIANSSDIGAVKALNLTKDLSIISPGIIIVNTTNVLGRTGCFRQAPPEEPQLSRTNYVDCCYAVQKIAVYDTHRPMHFRRNHDTDFILPHSFTYRTCVISLDMVNASAEDFFYLEQILYVATDTARRCTALYQALGGMATVGPKQLMEVYVLGKIWPFGNRDGALPGGDDSLAWRTRGQYSDFSRGAKTFD